MLSPRLPFSARPLGVDRAGPQHDAPACLRFIVRRDCRASAEHCRRPCFAPPPQTSLYLPAFSVTSAPFLR
eukprot:2426553-Alexandrium_andersonii.AAC.1